MFNQALNKRKEVVAIDGVIKDFNVQDPIKGERGQDRIPTRIRFIANK